MGGVVEVESVVADAVVGVVEYGVAVAVGEALIEGEHRVGCVTHLLGGTDVERGEDHHHLDAFLLALL